MNSPRRLTKTEEEYLEKLLEPEFPGRIELQSQLPKSLVQTIADSGDHRGSIEFRVGSGPQAPVGWRVPVEARAKDEDGTPIYYLLHVVNGFLKELEILRVDGNPIMRPPHPSELEVMVRGDEPVLNF
jgi:hypothetical protein